MPRKGAIDPRTGKRFDFIDPQKQIDAMKAQIAAAKRLEKALVARDDLLEFTKFTMPDPEAMNDLSRSRYEAAKFHTEVAKVLEAVERGEITQLIFCMPPRHGKSCAHDTPVLTPSGWRQHGDLAPGDYVFGPDGKPTKILEVSPDVDEVVPVTLSNGEVIRCHLNHEWRVYDRSCKRWRVLETRQIASRKLRVGPKGRGGRFVFQLPDFGALQFPRAALPLHPYVLGAWLGDGSAGSTRIAHSPQDREVVEHVASLGHPISGSFVQPGTNVAYTVFAGPKPGVGSDMQRSLKALGVLKSKHIPEVYLRASVEQRLQLLAGLIDTDGHVERATGRVRFSTCSEALRDGVFDLASTLGFRPYITFVEPATSSSGVVGKKITYQVGFQPTCQLPTRIPRKQILTFAKRRRIGIVSVGPAEKAGARSICVEREDGLYLVGRQLVVTKNTELATKRFSAWYSGRHPEHDVIVAAAGDDLAHDFGADVRAIMQTPQFHQVFPNHKLRRGGTAKDNIVTKEGGRLIFAGRGGQINGRGAHLLLVDDLYKDAEEARSQAIRDKTWDWLTKVALYRRMGKRLTVITMTRWHSDDIIGRLTDPENPHYNEQEARSWKIIRLPGLAEEDDPLGRKPGEALWPEPRRDGTCYDIEYHLANQRRDPLGFAALVQQRPTVADGILFRRETLQYYTPEQLPEDLRIYCASDHAVGEKQRNDPSCFVKIGVDRQNNIYILDCIWRRMATDVAVEAMLAMAGGDRKPLLWWAERGHISKSIGPFLRKRMEETGTYINLVEVTPAVDKEQRAQSIAARVAMGKVYFPKVSWWTERAINELLAFPNGNHDDFVDALAYIGLGLGNQFGPSSGMKPRRQQTEGTFNWLKQNDKWTEARKRAASLGGF